MRKSWVPSEVLKPKQVPIEGLVMLQQMQKEQMEFMQHHLQQSLLQQQQAMLAQQQMQQQMFGALMEKFTSTAVASVAAAPPAPAEVPSTVPRSAATERATADAKIAELMKSGSTNHEHWEQASGYLADKKLTHDEHKALTEVSSEFKKGLHSLMNCEERLNALKKRQELLNEEKMPPGLKPYCQPWTAASLDEKASMANTTISIVVPEAATLGELRELLYIRYHSLLAAIDLEVWTHRRKALKEETSFASFTEQLKCKLHAAALGVRKFTETVAAPPGLLNNNDDATYSAAVKNYTEIVKDMAHDRAKRQAQQKKEEERKTKEVEKVANMNAEELLDKRFKEIARKVVEETSPQKNKKDKQKNGVSPGAAPGHNQTGKKVTPKPKGKGKGKGKEQKKGKGKGKGNASEQSGKPFWQQKGKGKGKGKAQKGKSWRQ